MKYKTILACAFLLSSPATFAAEFETYRQTEYEALLELKEDAEAGSPESQYALYELYLVKSDYEMAYYWLELSADNRHLKALWDSFTTHHLGSNYPDDGRVINRTKAFHRLTQIEALAPESVVWYHIGLYHKHGWSGAVDTSKAFAYLYKASEANYGTAQLELGKLYASGTGVKRDNLEAYVWFSLGAQDWQNVQVHLTQMVLCSDTYLDGRDQMRSGATLRKIEKTRAGYAARLTAEQMRSAEQSILAFRARYPLRPAMPCSTSTEAPPPVQ